ncbi:MAG: 2-phospho-L-lactate transferase [Pseudolysinimonas sp.]
MNVTVLAGGVGGARFLLGVRAALRGTDAVVRAVVNTGDDMWLAGLRITPDLDSIMYALAGVNDTERGWGRQGETERVSAELQAWGVGWPWFTLGDLDLGAHISRTAWLRDGVSLSEVVQRLTARWPLGVQLIPATDDEVETHVITTDGRDLHFQEWWTRYRAAPPVARFEQRGIEHATAGADAVAAVREADVILLAPSNPVVSIGTILALPGMREAVAEARAPVVGVSPIIAGAVVRGMADQCLSAIGVETSALAVARHYGARSGGGVLDGWLVDEADAGIVDESPVPTRAVPLWMRDEALSAQIAREALALVE